MNWSKVILAAAWVAVSLVLAGLSEVIAATNRLTTPGLMAFGALYPNGSPGERWGGPPPLALLIDTIFWLLVLYAGYLAFLRIQRWYEER